MMDWRSWASMVWGLVLTAMFLLVVPYAMWQLADTLDSALWFWAAILPLFWAGAWVCKCDPHTIRIAAKIENPFGGHRDPKASVGLAILIFASFCIVLSQWLLFFIIR